jgi:hypothetical protein
VFPNNALNMVTVEVVVALEVVATCGNNPPCAGIFGIKLQCQHPRYCCDENSIPILFGSQQQQHMCGSAATWK